MKKAITAVVFTTGVWIVLKIDSVLTWVGL